ncbi:MAG: Gfo/Idh/MocA family protein [Fimbriimonas sp.]
MSIPLRIGIVGRRGAAHAPGFRAHPHCRLVAMCDVDEAQLAKDADAFEIPLRFTRFEEMLDHVDAVLVATPMQLHAAQTVTALGAGKHVLSEVTAAVSLDECWQIMEAARSSGRTYMMAENYCYLRENVLVRALVEKGFFGEPTFGEGEYLHDVKPYHHTADGGRTWRYYWQVGVPGITYGTHSLGPVMQWINAYDPEDRVESVVCMGTGRRTDPEHPHDDTATLLGQLRSGRLVRIRLDMMSNRPHQMTYYALQGTHGAYEAARIPGQPGHVWFGKNPPPGPTADEHRSWRPLEEFTEHLPEMWRNPPEEALRAGHGGGDYFIVKDFVDACLGERPNPIPPEVGLHWTAVGLASTVSLQNGGVPIRVPDFADAKQRPRPLDA